MFRSPQAIDSKITPEAAMYIAMDEINGRLADIQKTLSGETGSETTPFSSYTIDLTVAHTNLQITNKTPFRYLQVYCDGGVAGITIRMGDQSAEPLDVSQISAIPINNNPVFMYFSNDVRQGRSTLTIYWVRGESLSIKSPSNDISEAELAVRLGSANTLDRRGETILKDDFEGCFDWNLENGGAVGNLSLSTERAVTGKRCLKFTMPAANCSLGIVKQFPFVSLGRFGLEARIWVELGSTFTLSLWVYDGTNVYIGELIYDSIFLKFQVHEPSGIVDIKTGVTLQPGSFHYFKVVIDPVTKTYVRAIIDGIFLKIENYKLYTYGSVLNKQGIYKLVIGGYSGSPKKYYADNIIVTGNEP